MHRRIAGLPASNGASTVVTCVVLSGAAQASRNCAPVAGKSTLSRLEHAPEEGVAFAPPISTTG